jgi:phosphate-selective porin OprO/OprP
MSVEQLAERLRVMEEKNRKLAEELESTRREHGEQMRLILEKLGKLSGPSGEPEAGSGRRAGEIGGSPAPRYDAQPPDVETPVPDYTEGQFGPLSPPPGFPLPSVPKSTRFPLTGTFGPGFQFQTEDGEFRLQVHYLSQLEARIWGQSHQEPANSGFYLPRQRIYFSGNITKPIEYEFAINRAFGTLDLLNAFINIHLDDRLQVRFGRYFTPLTYDQYAIATFWMPTPERSLFTTNVGLGRQFGLMAWGFLLDKRLDYAAGVFNGSRNSFEPLSNGVDFVGYLNARPFQGSESLGFARFLNLGTSVAFGHQDQAPVPVSFRIAGIAPNADNPGPGTTPFLILNPDVIERGDRLLGSVHAAYFYKGLSLIGEWQYGYGTYARPAPGSQAQVPFSGYYVSGSYFLTGEQVERRTWVTPRRPLVPTKKGGDRGPGALEVVGRISQLRLGEQVFTSGFADPNLWSNSATTTEVGFNWYWNEYVKVYLFWLHGGFGEPVQYRPGGFQTSADMFWLRFQLYF